MFKNMFPSINMKLLPMKAHYFLFNLGTTPILANINVIARQKGFSPAVMGSFLTVLFIISTITKPFYGWLADHFKIHKFIFISMEAITGISYFLIYFIPSISNQVIVNSSIENTTILFCPPNPIWDKCIEHRIENNKINVFKCQLNCKSSMQDQICKNSADIKNCTTNLNVFNGDILIDMKTIEKNENCLSVQQFQNTSEINSLESFYSKVPKNGKNMDIMCDARCEDDILKGTLANLQAVPDNEIILKYEFWLFCVLYLIGCSSNLVVNSMGDTICFDLLGEHTHLYGKQRLWDSIGAGIIAIFVGIFIDISAGESTFKDYTIVYFLCLITIFFDVILCSMTLEYKQSVKSKSILKDVGKLFKSVKIFTFFCWVCFGGLFSAAIFGFVFWHLEELTEKLEQDECNTNYVKTLEGIDMLLQNIGEIPFFFWSGFLIKKLGHINCMHIILGAFAARFFYYSMLTNPWWVLPIEVLNGLTFGLFMAVMVSYANLIAPPGTEATLQGMVGALFDGIGMSIGNFAAGILFSDVGGHYTFGIFGIAAICVLIVQFLIYFLLSLFEKKKKNIEN